MTSRREEIKQIFENIQENIGNSGQRVRIRIDNGSPINLYAARTIPGQNVLLEIGPINKKNLPRGFARPRINGINITVESSQLSGGGDITLLLELHLKDAMDVFITFVARICEEMDALQDSADAVKAIIALIERWKNFFSNNSELLTEGRQTGLYGELHLMVRLCKSGVPIDKLVSAWTASNRTSQDFEFGSVSIEVKSTAAVDSTSVNITNVRQLDNAGLELLFLNRVLLDARQGNLQTLPKIIQEIRCEIAENAPEFELDFDEKILKASYRDSHAEHYSSRTYTERALYFYEVREGFPRILESDLPTGVTKASYEITTESCKPFEVMSNNVFAIIRKYCD